MAPDRRRSSPLVLHLSAALLAAVAAAVVSSALGIGPVLGTLVVWAASLLAVMASATLVARKRPAPARAPRVLRGSRVFE